MARKPPARRSVAALAVLSLALALLALPAGPAVA